EKKRRRLTINLTRAWLIAAFAYLLVGHLGDHATRRSTNDFNDAYLRSKLQYDMQTHGSSSSPYAFNDSQIIAQDTPLFQAQHAKEQDDTGRDGTSSVMLFLLGGAIAWLFFSRKANNFLTNYINGKPRTQGA
ncbi:MAG: hypothetical protein ACRD3W_27235, partial [Terriglobales bacterium]